MVWNIISRRTHLSPYLTALRNSSEFRGQSIIPEGLGYNIINPSTGFQRNFYCKTRLSRFKQELITTSFHQSYRSSAFASQNVGRLCSMPGFRHFSSHAYASTEKKSQKMLMYLTGLVFGMVGLSYAAVPLYRRFCQATGYGGTVTRRESVEEKIARHDSNQTVTSRCYLFLPLRSHLFTNGLWIGFFFFFFRLMNVWLFEIGQFPTDAHAHTGHSYI
ncbi:cytochrome C oxidase assembly protein CtaG/COX11 [Medicago truncatula]|uniref:Cytochrome C oxidase assembly protein CtaG/COX11 n=1 Tax=Medicago truncatula TaxID=3880 RepID=A0A072UWF1_MEDTR|nr:cytochrome C oxidase assembly protein CtaG/COX11 [Medicago truncatula]